MGKYVNNAWDTMAGQCKDWESKDYMEYHLYSGDDDVSVHVSVTCYQVLSVSCRGESGTG